MIKFLALFKDIIAYSKSPFDIKSEKKSLTARFQDLLFILLIYFTLVILSIPIVSFVEKYVFHFMEGHKLNKVHNNKSLIKILLSVSVVAPIIEEIFFRLPLRYNRNYLFRLIDFILKKVDIKAFWNKNYKPFYYLSICIFGIIHIFNYDINSKIYLIIFPIIILPQIIGGILMSYIRMKNGLIWSIALHSLFNGIVVIISLLFFNKTTIVKENTTLYELKIEKRMYGLDRPVFSSLKINNDSIVSFKANNAQFRDILKLLEENPVDYINQESRVDISLVTKEEKMSKEQFIKFLQREFAKRNNLYKKL